MTSVTVRHNFETAHRLPHLPGKCTSLHGHSWWAEVTVAADEVDPAAGTVVEFGLLKSRLREWVDTNLDHGSMLGATDPLCFTLRDYGCKVYRFGVDDPDGPYRHAQGLLWPTVENVACVLARVAQGVLPDIATAGTRVAEVRVRETHVNAATWRPQ